VDKKREVYSFFSKRQDKKKTNDSDFRDLICSLKEERCGKREAINPILYISIFLFFNTSVDPIKIISLTLLLFFIPYYKCIWEISKIYYANFIGLRPMVFRYNDVLILGDKIENLIERHIYELSIESDRFKMLKNFSPIYYIFTVTNPSEKINNKLESLFARISINDALYENSLFVSTWPLVSFIVMALPLIIIHRTLFDTFLQGTVWNFVIDESIVLIFFLVFVRQYHKDSILYKRVINIMESKKSIGVDSILIDDRKLLEKISYRVIHKRINVSYDSKDKTKEKKEDFSKIDYFAPPLDIGTIVNILLILITMIVMQLDNPSSKKTVLSIESNATSVKYELKGVDV
jgi:hypothetical protein